MISIRYLRDKNNHPWATIVGIKDENRIKVGYSMCCPKDRFSKALGREIAFGRAKNGVHGKSCLDYLFNSPSSHHPRLEVVRDELVYLYAWLFDRKEKTNVQEISGDRE